MLLLICMQLHVNGMYCVDISMPLCCSLNISNRFVEESSQSFRYAARSGLNFISEYHSRTGRECLSSVCTISTNNRAANSTETSTPSSLLHHWRTKVISEFPWSVYVIVASTVAGDKTSYYAFNYICIWRPFVHLLYVFRIIAFRQMRERTCLQCKM